MHLNTQLERDSVFITDLELCQLRLHKNATFPWLILIPSRNNAIEIIDLSTKDQLQLMKEIAQISHLVKTLFSPTKLNVANLGNIVSQLHVHIIARFETDPAWPQPVWNSGISSQYTSDDLTSRIQKILSLL